MRACSELALAGCMLAKSCFCFSLCKETGPGAQPRILSHEGTSFVARARGVEIHNSSSPWADYFGAVYNGQSPLPHQLGRLSFVYTNTPAWRSRHSPSANPFHDCDDPNQMRCSDARCGACRDGHCEYAVSYAEGSRIHVVEPRRGDAFAPGLASTGLAETAEWVAMGLHKDALDRAIRAKRVEPRQSGPGYLVLEFALCSDGRWHKCDAFGRKLATTAELLDEDALLAALETAAANEVECLACPPDAQDGRQQRPTTNHKLTEKQTQKNKKSYNLKKTDQNLMDIMNVYYALAVPHHVLVIGGMEISI